VAGIFKEQGVWSCGFDFLPDGLQAAGSPFDVIVGLNNVSASFARFNGKGIQIQAGANFGRSLGTNIPTVIGGFAFQCSVLPPGPNVSEIITLYDSSAGSPQIVLGYNAQGQVGAYSNGGSYSGGDLGIPSGLLGSLSDSGVLLPNAYNFIEFQATIDPIVGVVTIWVNNVQVYTFSGNTQQSTNSFVNQIYYGSSLGNGIQQSYDDLYLLDTTGIAPLNARLTPGRIQTDGPIGDSSTVGLNQWAHTTPQGTDWANAANIPADITQYDSDPTPGDRMSFVYPAISSPKVWFMNTWISAEQDAAGTISITPIFRSNNVDQVGDKISLSNGTYVYANQASSINPSTTLSWYSGSVVDAGACEIGVETTS
jgi:hypothetical protein